MHTCICTYVLFSNFTLGNFLLFSALIRKASKCAEQGSCFLSRKNPGVKINFQCNFRLQSSNLTFGFLLTTSSRTPPVAFFTKFAEVLYLLLYCISLFSVDQKSGKSCLTKIDKHLMLTRNEKIIQHYIYYYQYIYIYIYTQRSVEHKVLRYIPLNLNKLNITDVMYLSLTTVP